MDHLEPGVYEDLLSEKLEQEIEMLDDEDKTYYLENIDSAEATKLLTNYISDIVKEALDDINKEKILDKIDFANHLIRFLAERDEFIDRDNLLARKLQILASIVELRGKTQQQADSWGKAERPKYGFTVSHLFTGSLQDTTMESEICLDMKSADRVYWIVPFLWYSGVIRFKSALEDFLSRDNTQLYIITTTYTGNSDPKALDYLQGFNNQFPGKVRIKVTYDVRKKLHAKSYLFERNSGLDTAYIGSSNMSQGAMNNGIEWNVRVTGRENPQIIKAFKATFQTYWNDESFNDYDHDEYDRQRRIERKRMLGDGGRVVEIYSLYPEQKEILDKLDGARNLVNSKGENIGSWRNLVVAATGVGKTVVAAFDYRRFVNSNKGPSRLLFVAHREEILIQARNKFMAVLGQNDFGDLWVGNYKPTGNDMGHLFVSVQTLNSQKEQFDRLSADYYDYIVIDEVHHIEAKSYQFITDHFNPKILLGLTATPERADGQSILPEFDNRIAAEIRLPEAIDRRLLVPFQYFCIGDAATDLSTVRWVNGSYDERELFRKLNTESRRALVVNNLDMYLEDPFRCHAVCFCVNIDDARLFADYLCRHGFRADCLTGLDNERDRRSKLERLRNGEVNYLCVVDILNEGIDIPEIDTVLFLRPTKSLTVFLQQLGRGLRLSTEKNCLTVLDFVAQGRKEFNFESRLSALLHQSTHSVKQQVNSQVFMLPKGCTINMDKVSQNIILRNISQAIFNKKRIETEIRNWGNEMELTLDNFLRRYDLDIHILYKKTAEGSGRAANNKCWSWYLKECRKVSYASDNYTAIYEKNMWRFLHINSIAFVEFAEECITKGFDCLIDDSRRKMALWLYYVIYNDTIDAFGFNSVEEGLKKFGRYPAFVDELSQLLLYVRRHVVVPLQNINELGPDCPLKLFGCYTRQEQLLLLGCIDEHHFPQLQSGIYQVKDMNAELLWVTLNKSDKDFSPTTMYDDYAINANFFQWQSQNSASHTNAGQRYVDGKDRTFILFVRDAKVDDFGFNQAYYCLGPVKYKSSHGDKPMTIVWKMEHPIPRFILDKARKMAVG